MWYSSLQYIFIITSMNYTHACLAEGKIHIRKDPPEYDTQLHQVMRLQYLFILLPGPFWDAV